jgi:hypothetical protein
MMQHAEAARVPEPQANPDIFEPWVLLPTQLAGGERVHLSGETRLMAAVLADAIQLFMKHRQSPTASGKILFRETEAWILSRDRRWLLSFENICDALHINAGCMRRALVAAPAVDARRSLPFDAARLRVARGRRIRV